MKSVVVQLYLEKEKVFSTPEEELHFSINKRIFFCGTVSRSSSVKKLLNYISGKASISNNGICVSSYLWHRVDSIALTWPVPSFLVLLCPSAPGRQALCVPKGTENKRCHRVVPAATSRR